MKSKKHMIFKFQSTLPRRERQSDGRNHKPCSWFQSTLPRRERPFLMLRNGNSPCFNPRSHEGSDTTIGSGTSTMTMFQSTLPRRERPHAKKNIQDRQDVSIHAPTKGATLDYDCLCADFHVSIHAPTKGATFVNPLVLSSGTRFNPRSHEGSDRSGEIQP